MIVEPQLVDAERRAGRIQGTTATEQQDAEAPDPLDENEGVTAQTSMRQGRENLVAGSGCREPFDRVGYGIARGCQNIHRCNNAIHLAGVSYGRQVRIEDHGQMRVQFLEADGPLISTRDETSDLIGNAWVENASVIAVPVGRLDPAFLDLSSGFAGEITQKVVNYGLKLAVIGDVSAAVAASRPLADYIWETNRGDHIWFFDDEAALIEKLTGRSGH